MRRVVDFFIKTTQIATLRDVNSGPRAEKRTRFEVRRGVFRAIASKNVKKRYERPFARNFFDRDYYDCHVAEVVYFCVRAYSPTFLCLKNWKELEVYFCVRAYSPTFAS